MKQKRQQQILKIISERDIKTQEELTDALKSAGYLVTQATVSRDIKELGLIKLSLSDGTYKYAITQEEKRDNKEHISIFSKSVISIKSALHTIVVKTSSGMANAVAATLDSVLNNEILGTIAGDDTILIILNSEEQAEKMASRLLKMFNWKE
ncbi:MAG: arginine repressor [Clostridia bacterium]|nr:arginine repressor [Clostridia bacterium]